MTMNESPATEFDIKGFLKQLSERPGVYQMFNEQDVVIYVGKAKNLKRRVSSYFNKQHDDIKTRTMVSNVHRIEVILTDTESEAFILESTLIKRLKPRYNILFRDDKSYPYIFVSTKKKHPALSFHRGAKRRIGEYFGPFPNAAAVHQTLHALQKIFPVRQCADSVYNHRSRPCLQYQIKRCSGPCVGGLIADEDYQNDVRHTLMFLKGESFNVVEELGERMQSAAEELEFEQAGVYRDRIQALRAIQNQHLINQPDEKDLDVIAIAIDAGHVAITLMMYRAGNLWGSENYFPKLSLAFSDSEIFDAFVSQHYVQHPCPKTLLSTVDFDPAEKKELQNYLSEQAEQKVNIKNPTQKTEQGLIQLAITNAQSALKQHITQKANQTDRLKALQEVLMLKKLPEQMECFDISHTMGQQTVASCVVFTDGVPNTQMYRKFNIDGIEPGDDYAAMKQAVERRYTRLKKENQPMPDLIVIDGGKGQLNQAIDILKDLELEHVPLVSVAKGEGRKAGLEILYTPYNFDGIDLEPEDIALHLINYIRDEAHRFAITSHRHVRTKSQTQSTLEQIEGIGPKTRKALLLHFGGLGEIKNAAASELSKVKGISKDKAQRIYDFFHGD